MKIYITSDRDDRIGKLREVIAKIQELPHPPEIHLISRGKYSWELALGLGVKGTLKRDLDGKAVLRHLRVVDDAGGKS